tara:strand:- start:5547 stop:5999 length:453 start_codon:yes stop_codon:yes gene_type:complete
MTYYTRSQRGKNDSNTLSENNITAENKPIKKKKLYNCSACKKLTKQITNIICLIIFTFFYYANKAGIYVWKIGGIYIVWCTLHHITSQLYVYYCTPYTLLGFLTAPFMVATPQCTGLRWCIAHGAETIISMWLVLGTWFMQKLGGYSLDS